MLKRAYGDIPVEVPQQISELKEQNKYTNGKCGRCRIFRVKDIDHIRKRTVELYCLGSVRNDGITVINNMFFIVS